MYFKNLIHNIPILFSLVSYGVAAPDSFGAMTRFTLNNPATDQDKDADVQEPTWFAQYPAANTGLQNPESYDTNLALAKAHLEWLLATFDDKNGHLHSTYGWVTVAVMYDPVSMWHFASTVPRGPRSALMFETGERIASSWYNAAKPTDRKFVLHAEDGAYYNWEISGKAQITTGQGRRPYPAGTIVASYTHGNGKYGGGPVGPKPIPACSTAKFKQPNCQQVANTLGVQFSNQPLADAPAAESAGEPISEDLDTLTEAQLESLLCDDISDSQRRRVAIKGREVQLEERAACQKPFPISTFSYTHVSPLASSSAPSSPTASTSAQPVPSCSMQNEDPDEGITTEYCVCESTRTLPFLTISPTVVRSKSCEYTSLPPKDTKRAVTVTESINPIPIITPAPTALPRDLTITTGFGPATTDTKHCQVCKKVTNNEDSCSKLDDCIVQTGKVTIEAGTSSVHVGTLTGSALYTSVSSALEKICPTPTGSGFTSCKSDTVSIGDIHYVESDYLYQNGELQVSVESSKYNVSEVRSGLIKAAAAAAQQAATGKNCYEQEYEVGLLSRPRSWTSWVPEFFRRSDIVPPHQETATWCNTVGFAGPQYFGPYWALQSSPGATDYMDVHFAFHEPAGGDFDCSILEAAAGAFAFLAPEFAIADIGIEEAIGILCDEVNEQLRGRDLNTTLLDIPA